MGRSIKTWQRERGRRSRCGRLARATTEETIHKVHDMVLQERHIKMRKISEVLGSSTERACHTLTQEFGMSKVSAKWVPRLLTHKQKRVRCQISKENLEPFKKDQTDLLRKYVTMDETWINHYVQKTKEQ